MTRDQSKSARRASGLALLVALGVTTQANETRRSVAPETQDVVAPVTASWSDLAELQASLPADRSTARVAPTIALDTPVFELERAGRSLSVRELERPGSIERLGPCAGFPSEPAASLGMDSQLDVADGAGFSFIPPDVAGAVGPRHLMTMLENQVRITDRIGGSPLVLDTSVFWSPIGTTPLSPTHVYPRVFFDAESGRWLASIRNGVTSTGSTVIGFAISATDDPTGIWNYYAISADPTAATFADWVLMGYNSTWITLTANMFTTPSGASLAGAKMWVLDKASVLAGGPATVSVFPAGFMTTIHGSGGSSVHPARTLDANGTQWLINNSFTSGGVWLLQLTQITGTGGAPVASGVAGSPFGGSTSFCFVSTNFSSTQRSMSQVGDARFISPFSVRTASVAVRNGKIWVAMSGGLPGPATNASPTSNGVVWHQVDPTLPFPGSPGAPGTMVLQSGAITNGTNTMSMYPSIAVNCAEDVLIGYANGDATRNPRACYSIRLGTDALNFMGAINELKAGESSYWKNFGVGTTAQYGRYTSTCVDPNDDKTLWTLQEFADTRVGPADNDSRWGTWWGRFGDCEELPVITDEPDSLALCVGDPASFSVMVTSASPITYQWRKDGVDISGANSDTYSIPVTVSTDAGAYDCVVCGCGQAISAVATLSFNAPVITQQPVNQFAALGGSASFMVMATGTGTLLYQWYHDNVAISGANSDTYAVASVTAADYGDYHCVVTDDCGPVTSSVAKLSPPKKGKYFEPTELDLHIFDDPVSQTECVGGQAVFSVTAYPATVTYSWRKNGTPIVPAETNSTLVLDPVTAGDAAFYDVIVSLGSQSVVSTPAALTVIDVATITMQPGPVSQTVSPGVDITYNVTATGAGPITYQWEMRPTVPFAPFVDIPGATTNSLTIENVTANDAGTYRCKITNPCGTIRTVNLRVIVL